MNICYLILAHKNLGQLKRLISKLNDVGASFFIHVNKREEAFFKAVSEALSEFPNVHFVPRHKIWWGTFSMTKAVISSLQAIVDSDIPYDRVVFISGQDYPIKSKEEIKSFFEANSEKNYIEFFPVSVKNQWTEQEGDYNATNRISRTYFTYRSKLFMLPIKRKFPLNYVAYGGSFWWNLNRECVNYIVAFLKERPEFVQFMKYLFLPDEIFFNTLLANSPLRYTLVNTNLRYIDWEKPVANPPAILTMEDFEALQTSSALFARKFDVTCDEEILDKIDRELLTAEHLEALVV